MSEDVTHAILCVGEKDDARSAIFQDENDILISNTVTSQISLVESWQ